MQYFVHREGNNQGPYTLEDLQRQVATGAIRPNDLAWHEGLPQWQPVSTFVSTTAADPVVPAVVPVVPPVATPAGGSPEQIRQAYFSHEQNVRSIGTYFFFSGGLQLFLGALVLISGLVATMGGAGQGDHLVQFVVIGVESVIFLGLGAFTIWTAGRIKRLDRSAYIPGIVIAAIGLLGIPLGTIINGYILYLIVSEKGRFVLSNEYQAVVAATPQFQWKTALWVKIIIGLAIFVFVAVVVISVLLALGQHVASATPPVR